MAKILVAYFSRSGVTGQLAFRLAANLGADLETMRPMTRYTGGSGFLKGVLHSLFRRAPPVDCGRDPADYSVVIIGSPVWVGRLSAPMRSYLKRYRDRIGSVAAFWVSGSGLAYKQVGAEIEQLTGRTLLTAASFTEQEVRSTAADAKVEGIAQAVRTYLRDAASGPERVKTEEIH
jgi:flavodoxin